jgi:hypothetical protein
MRPASPTSIPGTGLLGRRAGRFRKPAAITATTTTRIAAGSTTGKSARFEPTLFYRHFPPAAVSAAGQQRPRYSPAACARRPCPKSNEPMRSPLRELRQPFGSKHSGPFRSPGRREPKCRERSGTQRGPSACLTGRIGKARQRFRSPVRRALLPVQSAFMGVDMIRDAAARPARPVNQCRALACSIVRRCGAPRTRNI